MKKRRNNCLRTKVLLTQEVIGFFDSAINRETIILISAMESVLLILTFLNWTFFEGMEIEITTGKNSLVGAKFCIYLLLFNFNINYYYYLEYVFFYYYLQKFIIFHLLLIK